MSDECVICGTLDRLQEHHISYKPEIKITVCKPCHLKIHKHGVGTSKDEMDEESSKATIDFIDKLMETRILEKVRSLENKYREIEYLMKSLNNNINSLNNTLEAVMGNATISDVSMIQSPLINSFQAK